MKKVKITADGVLAILKSILDDSDINFVITDGEDGFEGKAIQEVLNVEYYTFKHRPQSSVELISEKLKQGQQGMSQFAALNRSFCLVSISDIERLYSKDVDMATLTVTMEYWIQTSKIKLLENLIECANIELSGIRIPIFFGNERRKASVIFDSPNVTDVQTATVCGEMAVCEVTATVLFYPDVVSYSDYIVKFSFNDGDKRIDSEPIPLSSFSFVNTMTQKAVPYVDNKSKVGSINLSCANSFVMVFDGYNNEFINYIIDKSLSASMVNSTSDNNQSYIMTIIRAGKEYVHEVVIKDHQGIVNADTGNETHTLTLVTRGI